MSEIRDTGRMPVGPRPVEGATTETRRREPGVGEFQDQLDDCRLKFSNHAEDRLRRRRIELGDTEMARLERAVDKAESKGARNSLVLMGELAFIVNVSSRQVVTACSQERLREGVFTNIDSTVIVNSD